MNYMYFSRYYLTKPTLVTIYVHGTIIDNLIKKTAHVNNSKH